MKKYIELFEPNRATQKEFYPKINISKNPISP